MKKRHFSSQRLYNLSKLVVLTTTVLAVIIVVVSVAMLGIYELFREQSAYLFGNDNYRYTSTHIIDPEGWSLTLSRQTNEIIEIGFKWLVIAIAVPVLFFGGIALYKKKIFKYLTKPIIAVFVLFIFVIFSLWLLNKNNVYKAQIALLHQTQEELKQKQNLELKQNPQQENTEHISAGINNDGTLEAFFKVRYDKDRLVFNVLINQPPTTSGDVDPEIQTDRTEDGNLWEGNIPANGSTILNGTSVAFSPDGTKIALKAPDQTIHIWEITESIQDQPKESSRKRKILLKEFKKIQTIPRYGQGTILFSGDSKELYGSFNLENGMVDVYLLYPVMQKINSVTSYYGKFSIPRQPGFGYYKYDKASQTKQLVHWRSENNQYVYPLILKEEIISTLISPDAKQACIDVYSIRMNGWNWRDNREFAGSLNPGSEPESRIYDLFSGKELPIRIYPYRCVRWIDKNALLIKSDEREARYYNFNLITRKMSYLFESEDK